MQPFRRWLSLFVLFALPALAAEPSGLEQATNRPGGDYRHFDMSAPYPSDCQAACKADPECRAFTYVKPGVQGPRARCWLKSAVPPPNKDDNCVSGLVPRADPKPGELEYSVNRPGKDYRHFIMSSAKPEDCRAACNAEAPCRAFTYVKPGVQGPEARCWLKSEVPPPNRDVNCVSGVTVRAPDTGCGQCVATTCAAACKGAIVMLCVAGGTTTNDGTACQRCIDTQCKR
jgi:hypothetical protein